MLSNVQPLMQDTAVVPDEGRGWQEYHRAFARIPAHALHLTRCANAFHLPATVCHLVVQGQAPRAIMLGGHHTLHDLQHAAPHLTAVRLVDCPLPDGGLVAPHVLDLQLEAYAHLDLAALAGADALTRLRLNGSPKCTGANRLPRDIRHLHVDAAGSPLLDVGAVLRRCTRLTALHLGSTDDVPADVCELPGLRRLELPGCRSTRPRLSRLAGLTTLTRLSLAGAQHGLQLGPLTALTGLRHLDLSRSPGVQLRPLPPALTHLDVSHCLLADLSGVQALRELRELRAAGNPAAARPPASWWPHTVNISF